MIKIDIARFLLVAAIVFIAFAGEPDLVDAAIQYLCGCLW
jgi:hypothetical protein